MNIMYDKKINDSKEYKELVNNIDMEIIKIDKELDYLRKEKEKVLPIFKEYEKILDDIDDKLCDLDDNLNKNFGINQNIDNALKYLGRGAILTTLLTFLPLSYLTGISSNLVNLSTMYEITNIFLASFVFIGASFELLEKHPRVSEKTKKNAMKEKKNIEIRKDIDRYREIEREIFNNYSDVRDDVCIINSMISSKENEKDCLLSKKNKIINFVNNYDNNIDLYDNNRIFLEDKLNKAKIFKKSKDYRKYYANIIK